MSSAHRIVPVDAARGCAMVLVCLSHIKQHFPESSPALYEMLVATTRVATPTFLLLSGFVIAHLLRTDSRGNVAVTLIDRGLFLLVVAHVLLGLADLPEMDFLPWLVGRAMITDVIGIALFVAVVLRATSASALAVLGAALFVVSWIIGMVLSVDSGVARLLSSLLFNLQSVDSPMIDVPIIPYLGVFLLGMALSISLNTALVAREDRLIVRRLLLIGVGALVTVAVGILAWHFGKPYLPEALREPQMMEFLRSTLDPRRKSPPSPAYLLGYGGTGLVLLALLFHGRPARLVQPIMRIVSVIGRTSLMCFVVQDWMFFVLPKALGLNGITSVLFWFSYLAVCLLILYRLARWWDSANGNRFLTVGLKKITR